MSPDSIRADTLVFFGATGDLAYKKIFPALQAMVKRGTLNVPVIGVARGAGTWTGSRTGPKTVWKNMEDWIRRRSKSFVGCCNM